MALGNNGAIGTAIGRCHAAMTSAGLGVANGSMAMTAGCHPDGSPHFSSVQAIGLVPESRKFDGQGIRSDRDELGGHGKSRISSRSS
jgi:hypothetical protein